MLGLLIASTVQGKALDFRITFTREVSEKPFSGRVYVLLSREARSTLPAGLSWYSPDPLFAKDVKDWKPGEPLVIGADALGYPTQLDRLPDATYTAFAVMDFDRGDLSFLAAPGNGHSKPLRRELKTASSGEVTLTIDQVVTARPFKETDRVKLVDIESKLLTAFHGKPMRMRAAVVLPKSFGKDVDKKYPVIYEVPGFSGTHFNAHLAATRNATEVDGIEMLYVVLDPSCRLGHHVFADSANNGPYGRALIEELIPSIESKYRGLGAAGARFVTGHSSGGWSSLWLQVTYPEHFGGVWSTAPDPVDFRDFQRIDLTKPRANVFKDEQGQPRPIARRDKKPVLWYKDFSDMETVMGHGGQLASFEAVFSPRGADGKPRLLWDRVSGTVDPEVAKRWEGYDIRLILERNWKTLGPRLTRKLHVYMGEDDSYYLEGAVKLLRESLKKLGSDAVVELFPGKDHRTLLDRPMRERIAREMAVAYRHWREHGR
jgi:hypothetical protein